VVIINPLYLLAALSASYFVIGFGVALLYGGSECLPAHLQSQRHIDRIWIKRWLPRKMTARSLVEPPIMLWGSSCHGIAAAANGNLGPRPIPQAGQWQFSVVQVREGSWFCLPYFAFTTFFGLHFRIGTRWDDVDHYYTLDSMSIKFRSPKNND
jgi:hypothetical protein